jgi:hypothetical protein
MDTSAPSRIVAHHLQIIDDQGRPRLVLETVLGHPRFVLLDENGTIQAEISLDKDGRPSASLLNPSPGGATIELKVDQKGAHIRLQGPVPSFGHVFLTNDGVSDFVLVDKSGATRGQALTDDRTRTTGIPLE